MNQDGVEEMNKDQKFHDIQALTELSYSYARSIDTRDWNLLESLFLEDAYIEYHSTPKAVSRGIREFMEGARKGLGAMDATQHLFSNHEFVVDGDRARGRFSMIAQHIKRGMPGGSLYMLGGIYEDEYVRTDGGWKVSARSYRALWGCGNGAIISNRYPVDEPRL